METKAKQNKAKTPSNKNDALRCLALFLVGWIGLSVIATIYIFFVMVFQNVPFNEAMGYILQEVKTPSVIKALSQSWVDILVNGLAYISILAIMIIILKTDFLEHLKSFKKGNAILAGLIGYLLIIVFNLVYSNLVQPLYPVTDNTNETTLDSIIVIYPMISIIVFGIIGPICEELTYRVGLFSLLKKKSKALGYVLAILIFGFIHFAFESVLYFLLKGDSTWLINELLNMPTYMFAAAVFIYLFDNYGFAGSAAQDASQASEEDV